MPKLRIGVLMGGKSIEKEVSFNSGRTVCDHLDVNRFDIIPLYQTGNGILYILPWHFMHRGKTSDFEHRLTKEAQRVLWDELKQYIDFAYIAMHGRYAEDGILQGTLELLDIPYLGSSRFASALCMDKAKAKIMLSSLGIATPRDHLVPKMIAQNPEPHVGNIIESLRAKNILFPCIVKPHNEGSSIGVSFVHNEADLPRAIQKACLAQQTLPQDVLIEERISGMEFSCITLANKDGSHTILMPTEIVPESTKEIFDYDQKYMPGRAFKYTPPRCDAKIIAAIQKTCLTIMKAFHIETISRIDGFVRPDGHIVIIDPNTFSGMAPSSFVFREAAEMGMSHTDLINHLLEADIARYGIENKKDIIMKHSHTKNTKLRVGVLLGGASHEREISLESGRNVCYKLSPQKYQIIPLFIDHNQKIYRITQAQLVLNSTREIAQSIQPEQHVLWSNLKSMCDFVFIGLHGGAGENGSVQGMLEMLDIPYNGSGVFASSLCMDKAKTAEFLKASGFDVPMQKLICKADWIHKNEEIVQCIEKEFVYPLIVKPHDDGCSVMVQKIGTSKELAQAIEILFHDGKQYALVEEFIHGIELTVGVLGNVSAQALPPSKSIAAGDILSIEEKFLPGAGENQTPAPLPQKVLLFVQQTMEHVFKAIGCKGYARIDCFYQSAQQSPTGKERVIILEINTLPGLTPATCIFHQAAEIGLKPMEFIDRIIELGIENHQEKIIPSNASFIAHKETELS